MLQTFSIYMFIIAIPQKVQTLLHFLHVTVSTSRPDRLWVKVCVLCWNHKTAESQITPTQHAREQLNVLACSPSKWPTFGELPHILHVRRQILSYQSDQCMIVLELVYKVMAIKHMWAPLCLTRIEGGEKKYMKCI